MTGVDSQVFAINLAFASKMGGEISREKKPE